MMMNGNVFQGGNLQLFYCSTVLRIHLESESGLIIEIKNQTANVEFCSLVRKLLLYPDIMIISLILSVDFQETVHVYYGASDLVSLSSGI